MKKKKIEKVDPKLCEGCGYRGTPLCTHPDGLYHDGPFLVVPDYDPYDPKPYPGDIKPGEYSMADVQTLILAYQNNPDVQQFIRDMMEE